MCALFEKISSFEMRDGRTTDGERNAEGLSPLQEGENLCPRTRLKIFREFSRQAGDLLQDEWQFGYESLPIGHLHHDGTGGTGDFQLPFQCRKFCVEEDTGDRQGTAQGLSCASVFLS